MKRPRYANGVESNNKKCSSSEALPCEVYEFDSLKKKSTGLKVVAEDLLGIKLQSLRARSKSHLSSEVFAGYKREREEMKHYFGGESKIALRGTGNGEEILVFQQNYTVLGP